MSIKKGVLSVLNAEGTVVSTHEAWEVDFDGEKFLALRQNGSYKAVTTFNLDSSDLWRLFTEPSNSNPTVTWTTPLTEVPSTGGTSAPVEIAADTDLDTITSVGAYYRAANVTVTNAPSAIGTAPFALEVISTGGSNFIQRATRGTGTPSVYQRVCYNGTFGNWATL